ncbi:MAG: hypothetical protein AAGG48_31075 [Planctomycetota bacterium]
MKPTTIVCIIVSMLLCGCGQTTTSETSDFEGRLEAAAAVQETGQRDDALASVATDAADAGNGSVCLQAVSKVSATSLRDTLAEDCALKLARAGDSSAAYEVANKIVSASRRSDVNSTIAENE